MPTLIKAGQVIDNPWQLTEKETELAEVLAHTSSHLLVPLAFWQENKSALSACGKEIGIWLDGEDDPYSLRDDIETLSLIAVVFPVFMDGRSYSTASIIRERLEYRGELRAVGEVLRDQLFYMRKCGIDSFDLSDEVKIEDALSAFNDFNNNYQSTTEERLPLFRRR